MWSVYVKIYLFIIRIHPLELQILVSIAVFVIEESQPSCECHFIHPEEQSGSVIRFVREVSCYWYKKMAIFSYYTKYLFCGKFWIFEEKINGKWLQDILSPILLEKFLVFLESITRNGFSSWASDGESRRRLGRRIRRRQDSRANGWTWWYFLYPLLIAYLLVFLLLLLAVYSRI